MPSIKTCLVSFAAIALAFGSAVEAHTATSTHNLAARNVAEKRSMSAIAAARAAAIRGRTRGNSGSHSASAAAPASTEPSSSSSGEIDPNAYEAGSPFLTSSMAVAAAQKRCAPGARGDQSCVSRVDTSGDPNLVAICGADYRCTIRCADGFAPTDSTNAECVAEPTDCQGNTCMDIDNGYYSCNGADCVYSCDVASGYSLVGGDECVSTNVDVDNCGTVGNACPGSYNGVGNARCVFGTCSVACPFGTYLRSSGDETQPFLCA